MCLVAFQWQPDQPIPLWLLANRDEFYARPSEPAHRWPGTVPIFAGRDQQAGGTWMGVGAGGRWGLLTNYREVPAQTGGPSRGDLICHYLAGNQDARGYLQQLQPRAQRYAGFNLLLGDSNGLCYFSNRQGQIHSLSPGVYGLCNHLLDTPWPKVQRLKQGLQRGLAQGESLSALLALLRDPQPAPDHALPETGVGLTLERQLSPIFIHTPQYGTRLSTLWRQDQQGQWDWLEQAFDGDGAMGAPRHHRLSADLATRLAPCCPS
ncbi:NRDE family protein [Ferrimonas pelagia]|uniref:NRDE family protein n=1 Tax=Ferrimonas pelagia TaxID=1177826 RepID=A0ABP9FCM8_9GAMM